MRPCIDEWECLRQPRVDVVDRNRIRMLECHGSFRYISVQLSLSLDSDVTCVPKLTWLICLEHSGPRGEMTKPETTCRIGPCGRSRRRVRPCSISSRLSWNKGVANSARRGTMLIGLCGGSCGLKKLPMLQWDI